LPEGADEDAQAVEWVPFTACCHSRLCVVGGNRAVEPLEQLAEILLPLIEAAVQVVQQHISHGVDALHFQAGVLPEPNGW
jgi:hypothetical protein